MSPLPQYAELHCLSNFTFLRGASHAEELVAQAKELGYTALAITDECSLAGVVRAHTALKKLGDLEYFYVCRVSDQCARHNSVFIKNGVVTALAEWYSD